jgi:hypothetical protein
MHEMLMILIFVIVKCEARSEFVDVMFKMWFGSLLEPYEECNYYPRDGDTMLAPISYDEMVERMSEYEKDADVLLNTSIPMPWIFCEHMRPPNKPACDINPPYDQPYYNWAVEKPEPIVVDFIDDRRECPDSVAAVATFNYRCSPSRLAPYMVDRHAWDYVLVLDKLELNHTLVV